ncbi:histone-fold-containing protein [Irpex rosettiformis]|uniref:Histone-fold-containing protein n=1 Tax=Irpex rosettiformis TaxID=378272 RepID=A0ACB8TT84_9APHY|nr:histone-fold-containing protein [Irpex rosettiformis]
MKNKNKQTRFPVARIKRIMQKDEEVGKVAQATPVVISKALEMFLGMIVEEASKVTTDRGSKKLEAYHLKHAIETVDVLDFLKEIVEAVPDPSAGGTIDLAAEAAEKAAAKKRAGRRKSAAEGEEGAAPAPRRRRRKDDGDGAQSKPRGRGRAKVAQEDEMDEGEDDGPEPEEGVTGYAAGSRAQEDDDDWEG